MSDIHKERKKQGLCVCGNMLDREGYYCSICYEKYKVWRHNHVCKYHEEGKCSTCGAPLDRGGWFCKECVEKLRVRGKVRSAERRANGLCVQCGEKTDGTSQCRRCLDMLKERRARCASTKNLKR